MIAPVRCRWLRLHGEAARLLGSQKSQRFCRIAKSLTSFDPASIASGCCQPLMSAPASVPRVARPSEATSFARSVHPSPVPYILLPFRTSFSRSAYITDVIFFRLCPIHIVANSALVKILPPQQGDILVLSAGYLLGSRCMVSSRWPMQGVFPGAMQCYPFGCIGWISVRWNMLGASRGSMRGLLSGADVGSPFGCLSMVSVQGQISSIFMKFTWHANLHYRYL